MRTVRGRGDLEIPVLGLGTWRMGEDGRRRRAEVAALRVGLDLGLTLIDTAEMYGSGGAEQVVGEAVRGRRDEALLVSKVLPGNASRDGTVQAAERSLARLGTDRIDLYLLHWPGPHPLIDTLEAFVRLREQGKILHYGVSNFDLDDLDRAVFLAAGEGIASNQVPYNLARRGIEHALLERCRGLELVVMAYSPLEQGRLDATGALARVARRHGASPMQVALAWTMRHEGVVAIPKAARPEHVRDNAGAVGIGLSREDLAELDREFPPPRGGSPLEFL